MSIKCWLIDTFAPQFNSAAGCMDGCSTVLLAVKVPAGPARSVLIPVGKHVVVGSEVDGHSIQY